MGGIPIRDCCTLRSMELDYDIRLIRAAEHALLQKMLYLAIFVPPGNPPPDEAIIREPRLARIYDDWGRPGDLALVATLRHEHGEPGGAGDAGTEEHHHPVIIGAAWYRLYPAEAPGYGFVAEDIPELSVAVEPEYRRRGVGTALLRALISRGTEVGYRGISLSVDARNPALRLYERLGFRAVKSDGNPTMLLELRPA